MEHELVIACPQVGLSFARRAWGWIRRPWTVAKAHGLKPWLFVVMFLFSTAWNVRYCVYA